MTPAEIISTAKELIDEFNKIKDQYLAKINEIDTKINELQQNTKNKSEQFIKTQREKLEKELNEVKAAMDAKINKVQTSINNWRDKQIETLTGNIERALMVKLGIDISISDLAKKAAETTKNVMNN
jgi:hypothetical protein